jgi:putative hydrolase of the HAD superfamily
MERISAIGFDLFNTLLTVEPDTLGEAFDRLAGSLRDSGLPVDRDRFREVHRQAAIRFLKATQEDGRETHNRFWISEALGSLGHEVPPEDPRVASAVDAYFSAFRESCRLIPGTREMLAALRPHYRLGLLSNFTHGPAARRILNDLELPGWFDALLISGELGYRKPHPSVFHRLAAALEARPEETLYVGDDPGPDIHGARAAGVRPVWFTYTQDRAMRYIADASYLNAASPDGAVPRVSDWGEFLTLLGRA